MNYYYVGGYLRDELMGIRSKDIDFAIEDATYEEMRADILYSRKGTIFQERPEFLSIRARIPEIGAADFTLCRKEGFYSDARHPDNVEAGNIYQDLSRRDFTVNAIARNEETGQWVDPFGGREDIIERRLVCVGNPEDRFNEDALRILRAMRFHITKGFSLDPTLDKALRDYGIIDNLLQIPKERIYEELKRCYEHSTLQTVLFLRKHRELEDLLFLPIGMELRPQL